MPTQAITPNGWVLYGQPIRGRSCAGCTLCCTLVPVDLRMGSGPIGEKPAGVKCPLLGRRGCTIYARRPDPCRYWSCRWLFDAATADMRRPDKAHYCVDSMPDETVVNGQVIAMLQVWCDPAHRDAHHDPALRAYIAGLSMPAIIRFAQDDAVLIAPPPLTVEGEWLEIPVEVISKEAQAAKLAAVGARRFLDRVGPADVRIS